MQKQLPLLLVLLLSLWLQTLYAQDFSISKDSITEVLNVSFNKANNKDYEEALKLQNFALEWGINHTNDSIVGEAYDCIGSTFYLLKNYEKAEFNYKKSLVFLKKANYKSYMVYHYNNMASLYFQQKKTDEYKEQFLLSKQIALDIKSPYHAFWPTYNIALLSYKKKDYNTALPLFKETIQYFQPNTEHQPSILTECYNAIATIYSESKQYNEALKALAVVDSLGLDQKNYFELIKSEELKHAIYSSRKEYIPANTSLLKKIDYLETSSKIDAEALKKKTILEQKLIEQEEVNKEHTNTIAQTKLFSIIIFILFAITALILFLLHRNNDKRNKLNKTLITKNKELIEANKKTEYASNLKANFFSTISHELRTPLYAVTGITDILIEDNPKTEQKHYLRTLKSSGEYLLALINNVLQINKFDADKIELNTIHFNLKTLVSNIKNSLTYLKQENNNTIEIDIKETVPIRLKGDSLKLSQILINLFSNALKFTHDGHILLSIDVKEKLDNKVVLHFSIKDDGIGISEDLQSKIFEDFYQESMHLERNYEGTGLGLAIVKRLLKVMGSKIEIKSTQGKGSNFYFDLDLEIATTENTKNDKPVNFIDLANKAILVVDDNQVNQMITKRILENKKAIVTVVDSGIEAIKATENNDYAIILMDIHMPKMNGYTATQNIRQFNPTVPIIALTAVKLDENKEKIYASGMNGIIVKPFRLENFFSEINRFL